MHLYISYKLSQCLRNLNTDFTLKSCLFGSVKLIKNADPGKYKHSGYDIGFDWRSEFQFTISISVQNFNFTFGADINWSEHINNKNKDILIFGEEPTEGLDDTTLTVEAKHPISFNRKNICIKPILQWKQQFSIC